jgi:ubiquinone/menaquinone biosynthesis C-methylase UbiE
MAERLPQGWVYAVDIAPRFVEYLSQVAANSKHRNMTPVLAGQNAVRLAPGSIDLAFVCDTYHHFEFPGATLASIHRALRPQGTLVVIDFERIQGKSREFVMKHVRAGKTTFRTEIEAAGFALAEEVQVAGLEENYFLRFIKR